MTVLNKFPQEDKDLNANQKEKTENIKKARQNPRYLKINHTQFQNKIVNKLRIDRN